MKLRECCTFDCDQGRRCPKRADLAEYERRVSLSFWRNVLVWLIQKYANKQQLGTERDN